MNQALRSLLPAVGLALLLTAALVVWIRTTPLDMPQAPQVMLSLVLLGALLVLLILVLRTQRADPNGGVAIDHREFT